MKSLLPYLLFVGVITLGGYVVYQYGYTRGSAAVKAQWDQDKILTRAVQDELLVQISKQEEKHRLEQEKIANDLAQIRQHYEMVLADQRAVYEQRLLQSSRRAEVYQQQAQAGATAQRALADHAARLDRALEEGLELVGELTATLGLREHQLRLLGEQIMKDRQLLEERIND